MRSFKFFHKNVDYLYPPDITDFWGRMSYDEGFIRGQNGGNSVSPYYYGTSSYKIWMRGYIDGTYNRVENIDITINFE